MSGAPRAVTCLPAALAAVVLCCRAEPPGGARPAEPPPPATAPAATPPAANLLTNPSFEAGREGWRSLATPRRPYWREFDVDTRGRSGSAALLRLVPRGPDDARAVYGVVQDLTARPVPRYLSGHYRVDGWHRGTANQYLQAVVIVPAPASPPPSWPAGLPNLQLAYVLAGIDVPPFQIGNRRFLFIGPREPPTGRWTFFERDLRADFEAQWGLTPDDNGGLRVLFEARWDDRKPDEPSPAGEVRYDDLYLGPSSMTRR